MFDFTKVAIPIPSCEGQDLILFVVFDEEFAKSQYLFLLAKVKTNILDFIDNDINVAIPIPSCEGQDDINGVGEEALLGRNTYSFLRRSRPALYDLGLFVNTVAIPIPSCEGQDGGRWLGREGH